MYVVMSKSFLLSRQTSYKRRLYSQQKIGPIFDVCLTQVGTDIKTVRLNEALGLHRFRQIVYFVNFGLRV
jgi:hypothetical protein